MFDIFSNPSIEVVSFAHFKIFCFFLFLYTILQLASMKLKYEFLEKELVASRNGTKEKLEKYMEKEVGTVLSQLSNSRMKIEAQLRQNHQVLKLFLVDLCYFCSNFQQLY